jgi:uncharacterized protein
MHTLSVENLSYVILLLFAAGIFASFISGLFGIGGGTVLVPAFYQVFSSIGVDENVRMHLAVGTSTAFVVVTSLRSFMQHTQNKSVDMSLLKSWLVPIPIGAFAGVYALNYISSDMLRIIFAILCTLISVKLLFQRDGWRFGDDVPKGFLRVSVGFIIGFISTLMGVGGGVLNNTFMMSYGRSIHQAVATSSGVGVMIAIPGVIGLIFSGSYDQNLPDFSIGYIHWLSFLLVVPLTLWITPFGVRIAQSTSKKRLEMALGSYLIVVAIRFFMTLF